MMKQDEMTTIHIQYFAFLREIRGLSEESVTTSAHTVRELYNELNAKYDFQLPAENLKVAINDEFKDWDSPIRAEDSIAFIPPVAGG